MVAANYLLSSDWMILYFAPEINHKSVTCGICHNSATRGRTPYVYMCNGTYFSIMVMSINYLNMQVQYVTPT